MTTTESWLIDLDGVLWLAKEPIPGSADALARLRASGRRLGFFTNNSYAPHAELVGRFTRFGIEIAAEELLSSAQAAARLVAPGERAYVVGGPGTREALAARGATLLDALPGEDVVVDAVVVGRDPEFDAARLATAVRAVLAGARLIGTNDDALFPTPRGPMPGGGTMLAAVAYGAGATPLVAGKPNDPALELIEERLGEVAVVVGDRPETDGGIARRIGARFALVHSGVTPADHGPLDPAPDEEAPDLAALVRSVLGWGR